MLPDHRQGQYGAAFWKTVSAMLSFLPRIAQTPALAG
jgi:hypothetical protein